MTLARSHCRGSAGSFCGGERSRWGSCGKHDDGNNERRRRRGSGDDDEDEAAEARAAVSKLRSQLADSRRATAALQVENRRLTVENERLSSSLTQLQLLRSEELVEVAELRRQVQLLRREEEEEGGEGGGGFEIADDDAATAAAIAGGKGRKEKQREERSDDERVSNVADGNALWRGSDAISMASVLPRGPGLEKKEDPIEGDYDGQDDDNDDAKSDDGSIDPFEEIDEEDKKTECNKDDPLVHPVVRRFSALVGAENAPAIVSSSRRQSGMDGDDDTDDDVSCCGEDEEFQISFGSLWFDFDEDQRIMTVKDERKERSRRQQRRQSAPPDDQDSSCCSGTLASGNRSLWSSTLNLAAGLMSRRGSLTSEEADGCGGRERARRSSVCSSSNDDSGNCNDLAATPMMQEMATLAGDSNSHDDDCRFLSWDHTLKKK